MKRKVIICMPLIGKMSPPWSS